MLRTRAPLIKDPKVLASFDLHVLSTPPAFVLSQDQTLHLCSRLSNPIISKDDQELHQGNPQASIQRVSEHCSIVKVLLGTVPVRQQKEVDATRAFHPFQIVCLAQFVSAGYRIPRLAFRVKGF